jgi:hypothetical protein
MSDTNQKNTWETIVLIILVVAIAVDYYVLIQHQIKIKDLERAKIYAERAQRTMHVLEERYCEGIWKNNQCMAMTCVDSDEDETDPTAIKGQVTYIDENGDEQIAHDECVEGTGEVREMVCIVDEATETASPSEEVVTCPSGCDAGACLVQ